MQALDQRITVKVCMGLGGIAAGGEQVLRAFTEQLENEKMQASVGRRCEARKVGCMGLCAKDVLVEVTCAGRKATYQCVRPEMVARIIAEHILGGRPVTEWLAEPGYADFLEKQQKLVLSNCGQIDPQDIDSYLEAGGYQAARKALFCMTPEQIVGEIKASGLRGRGGAGFPTGIKWEACSLFAGDQKYIICNADEGVSGSFVDRAIIEGDPHAIIEGMVIGAYAIGASKGIVYIRDEYPLAVERLGKAISQASARGYLGRQVFGKDIDFDLEVKRGARAYVCGEETALIASLEDQIGEPAQRPPLPVQRGLWGKPTAVNNVETWATVPRIIDKGAGWFAGLGTLHSKGTKIISLVGRIQNTGLVEVVLGTSLREIIYDIGGGIPGNRKLKAVLIGGPSGGCIPASQIDVPLSFEDLTALGSSLGSGDMIVLDEDVCMVDVARHFLAFCMDESCGKCVPCREGTRELARLLDEICQGEGTQAHLGLLEELSAVVREASLCGLGKTAPNSVVSSLKYFRNEYEAHINGRCCPAGVCNMKQGSLTEAAVIFEESL